MDRVELAVCESRKKREESSSFASFQEEERFEGAILCAHHLSFKNTGSLSFSR